MKCLTQSLELTSARGSCDLESSIAPPPSEAFSPYGLYSASKTDPSFFLFIYDHLYDFRKLRAPSTSSSVSSCPRDLSSGILLKILTLKRENQNSSPGSHNSTRKFALSSRDLGRRSGHRRDTFSQILRQDVPKSPQAGGPQLFKDGYKVHGLHPLFGS